jgi:hypothetical protein
LSSSDLPKAERLTLAASCSAADAMEELPFALCRRFFVGGRGERKPVLSRARRLR